MSPLLASSLQRFLILDFTFSEISYLHSEEACELNDIEDAFDYGPSLN